MSGIDREVYFEALGRQHAYELILMKLIDHLTRSGALSYDDLQMIFAEPPKSSETSEPELHAFQEQFLRGLSAQFQDLQTGALPRLLAYFPEGGDKPASDA